MPQYVKTKEYGQIMKWSEGTVHNRHSRGEFLPGLVEIPNQNGRPTLRFDLDRIDKDIQEQAGNKVYLLPVSKAE